MIKNLLSLLLAILSFNLISQEYSINGSVPGLELNSVYLLRITGDSRKVIDTAQTDMTGSFVFQVEKDFPVGQYAVLAGKSQLVELIFNKENIRFTTTGNTPNDQVQIIESIENMIYYDYLSIKGTSLYKLDYLYPLLRNYPKDDGFYQVTIDKVIQLQKEVDDRVETLTEENPEALSSRFIKVDRPVFTDPTLSSEQQNNYLKQHYFGEGDFLDTLLLNSNILTGKIISYLTLFQKKGMSQEQLEEQLIVALDTVLEKAFVDQQVYEFVVDFLISGFEAIGFEKGLEHIATHNQLSELCVNSERKKELENKMEIIKRLAIGQSAPDFTFTDDAGQSNSLYNIQSERIVLAFWASWCPHCNQVLPSLNQYYDPNKTSDLEIISVSIDENAEEWQQAIEENGYNWINIAELQGWRGSIVEKYGIAATPSFFVLDKNKNIIAKPTNKKELNDFLGK